MIDVRVRHSLEFREHEVVSLAALKEFFNSLPEHALVEFEITTPSYEDYEDRIAHPDYVSAIHANWVESS